MKRRTPPQLSSTPLFLAAAIAAAAGLPMSVLGQEPGAPAVPGAGAPATTPAAPAAGPPEGAGGTPVPPNQAPQNQAGTGGTPVPPAAAPAAAPAAPPAASPAQPPSEK